MARLRQVGMAGLLLLPGVLTVALAFSSGGFFAGTTAKAAIVVLGVLIVRLLVSRPPLEGLGRVGLIATVALGSFTGWVLLSATWSHAPARALIEQDRALLYLAVFVLFASVGHTRERLRVVVFGITVALLVVCVAGLLSRTLPEVVTAPARLSPERLSYPISYWNGMGLAGAIGVVLCFHWVADVREPVAARIVAAAAAPPMAAVVMLTSSRAGLGVLVGATVLYLLLRGGRGILPGVIGIGPAVAAAIVAYASDPLFEANYASSAAGSEAGRTLLIATLGCALVAVGLVVLVGWAARGAQRRFAALGARRRRHLRLGVVGAVVVGLGAIAVQAELPVMAQRAADQFLSGGPRTGDRAERLTSFANQDRREQWAVALKGFDADRFKGAGAGTYANLWNRFRTSDGTVYDAHSLYFETLGELGLVGFALLIIGLTALLTGALRRVRRGDENGVAVVVAVMAAYLVATAVDWHWETPAVSVWFFALAGCAGARRRVEGPVASSGYRLQAALAAGAVCCVALAAVPFLVVRSQSALDRGTTAYLAGNCDSARTELLRSLDALSLRPEPWEFLGYCAARDGDASLAVRSLNLAVDRDPADSRLRYARAIVKATFGMDPRPDLRTAQRWDPRSQLISEARRQLSVDAPREWRARARGLPLGLRRVSAADG